MELGQQILFFISALGVFNGFLLSFYFLFIIKSKQTPYRYFGLLLLMLSLRIGKSVLYFFHPSLAKLYLQIGLSACWFIGPLLFLYIFSSRHSRVKGISHDMVHLGLLLFIILGVGFLFPYPKHPDLWNPLIVQGIYLLWAIYVLLAAYPLKNQLLQLFDPSAQLAQHDKWLLGVWGMNFLICLVFNSILYLGFPSYIIGPISFSLIFYVLMGFIMLFPNSLGLIGGLHVRSSKREIDKDTIDKLDRGLHLLMHQAHLYQDPSLSLDQLAHKLEVRPHVLSQYLNEHKGKTFSAFINEHRIQASQKLLNSHSHLTMEGIGQEVGFRSKSAFYTAFKKYMGTTPSQFSKQLKTSSAKA